MCVCQVKTKHQGKEAVGGKSFDRLLNSLVYNGLFVAQYHFLNLKDSFVHLSCKIYAIIFLSFVPND